LVYKPILIATILLLTATVMGTLHRVGGVDVEPSLYQKLVTREFLVTCLQKANLDAELLGDVADACDVNEYTALLLAAGDLTIDHIASKLYLTEDEARTVLAVCRTECRGSGIPLPGVDEAVNETGTQHLLLDILDCIRNVACCSPHASGLTMISACRLQSP
jgi:hypothetical protein